MITRRGFLKATAIVPLATPSGVELLGLAPEQFRRPETRVPAPSCRHFLDRTVEEWLQAFLEGREPPELPCRAMSCFGAALIPLALHAIPHIQKWKQLRLVECIAQTGKTGLPALVGLMEDASPSVRAAACRGVFEALDSDLDSPPLTAPAFAEVLDATRTLPRPEWKQAFDNVVVAMEMAESSNVAGPEVLSAMIAKLTDPEPQVRKAAAAFLRLLVLWERVPKPHQDRIVKLLQSLEAGQPLADWSQEVIEASRCRPYLSLPQRVMKRETLARMLRDPSARVRAYAAKSLGDPYWDGEMTLIPALRDPDIAVRLAAAEALGNVGFALSARGLHAALCDPCLQVAARAQWSLMRLLARL